MAAKAHGGAAGVLATYDFPGFKLIGDIGGGRGHLLQAVLDCVPSAKGVLFRESHVIKDAAAVASQRLTLQSGDFFNNAPARCGLTAALGRTKVSGTLDTLSNPGKERQS